MLNIQPHHSARQKAIITALKLLLMLLLLQPNILSTFLAGAHRWLVFSSTNRFNLSGLAIRESIVRLQS